MNKEIRAIRRSLDITQTQVGEKLGCSSSYVSAVEGGRVGLSVKFAQQMLSLYGKKLIIGDK